MARRNPDPDPNRLLEDLRAYSAQLNADIEDGVLLTDDVAMFLWLFDELDTALTHGVVALPHEWRRLRSKS